MPRHFWAQKQAADGLTIPFSYLPAIVAGFLQAAASEQHDVAGSVQAAARKKHDVAASMQAA